MEGCRIHSTGLELLSKVNLINRLTINFWWRLCPRSQSFILNRWLQYSYKKESRKWIRCGPEGSRRFRLPDFHDIRHMKVVRLSASRTGRLYPQECSWYSFSLGAVSTPRPWYGRKEYVTEKSSDTTGNRSRERPTSSASP